jgi:hypothetical protein
VSRGSELGLRPPSPDQRRSIQALRQNPILSHSHNAASAGNMASPKPFFGVSDHEVDRRPFAFAGVTLIGHWITQNTVAEYAGLSDRRAALVRVHRFVG